MNLKLIASSCCVLLLAAVPAHAGFKWLPDGQTPYADTQTPKPTMSLPGASSSGASINQNSQTNTPSLEHVNGGGIFLPLPGQDSMSGTTVTPTTRTSSPAITRGPAIANPAPTTKNFDPVFKTTLSNMSQNAPPQQRGMTIRDNFSTPKSSAAGNFAVIEGFGSEIPLAMALRQVVPADYAYAFGNGVNPGYRVSWNGGQPWNDVVFAMINPLDLVAYVKDKKIYINKRTSAGQQSMMVSSAPPSPSSTMPPLEAPISAPPPVIPISSMATMGAQGPIYSQENFHSAGQTQSAVKKGPQNQDGFTSLEGGRSNILDPGLHKRPQAAKTVSKIKKWTKFDKLNKDTKVRLTDVSQTPNTPQRSPIKPVVTEVVRPAPAQKFAYQTSLMEDVNQPAAWQARQGDSVFAVLGRWAEQANVKLIWNARDDYLVANDVFVNGPFPQALEDLVTNGVMSGHRPALDFYETPTEKHVGTVVIKDR